VSTIPGNDNIGSALVLGGGIGGMQAALDLAECGIKVYLADPKPSIGGVMSQLDKTFPTNDCAMCTIAPRLVDIGRHKDIGILTLTELAKVEGEAGHFRVTLKQKARYVDTDKCTGCGLCFAGCPVTMENGYDLGLSQRKAIYTLFPQAVPNKAVIDKRAGRPCNAGCMDACPAETNVPGYVRLIAEGKFLDAYQMLRNAHPFPSVCGRVCFAPCEDNCNRGQLDHPIAIRELKMFAADQINIDDLPLPQITPTGKTVAIIGAGPAGLTAANDLALEGHHVTVFEEQSEPGGMLRYGIPGYRLPREITRKEIGYIQKLGVDIKLGVKIGEDMPFAALRTNFDAVFIGVGAQEGMTLDIEGENIPGVTDGIRFLRNLNLGLETSVGRRVVVIGGGDTAIDCVRTAKRLGAEEIRLVYRRSRAEMPAAREEIAAMEAEGITIEFLTLPRRFLAEGEKLAAMECCRMDLGEPDRSGRRRPVPIPGSEFIMPVDTVITAIGQKTALAFLNDSEIATRLNGTIAADRQTAATNLDGVFAGGDVITGAGFVIDAIAEGKNAARSISLYLKGQPVIAPPEKQRPGRLTNSAVAALKEQYPVQRRPHMPELPVTERITNFREVVLGFDRETAIREAKRCLASQIPGCIECHECERRCTAHAIDFTQRDDVIHLEVGAIIVSPGFDLVDPAAQRDLGYGRYPNVVTALQFERILSPSGPYSGHVLRPSDKTPPMRIAFLQCVGSRDHDHDYCSASCCMYATKEAIIAREHAGSDVRCDIFYMDIRAFSKGCESYVESAKKHGVNYVRCRVPVIEERPETHNLVVRFVNDAGAKASKEYDLVVLSTGMQPIKEADQLADILGIGTNAFGFCETSPFSPVESKRKGVYVAGPYVEPKDIPETVIQGSAAASKVLALLKEVRGSLIVPKDFPPELEVNEEKPRVGVFVCHCGTNIGGVVNVPDVTEYARTIPGVVYAENNLYTCSNDTQERIRTKIREHRLNRVVVASCTPRTHEPLFRNTIREAGLNPYFFEMANIRDQCSWVHMHEAEKATRKARDLLRIAVVKVKLNRPLYSHPLEINHDALVIGGGIAGMTAALDLAEQGYVVHLLEREPELGGYLRRTRYLLTGENPQGYLGHLIGQVRSHPGIRVHLNTMLTETTGSIGNFDSKVHVGGDGTSLHIKHGVIVVATGAEVYHPKEYLYQHDPRVLLHDELEMQITANTFEGSTVAFIQCVGSRNDEHPYCSRTCCTDTIRHALMLKEIRPDVQIYVLYRDLRTYGFRESFYTQARKLGVAFIRFADDEPPVVTADPGAISVSVHDGTVNEDITLMVDKLVLAAAAVPRQSNKELAQALKVPLGEDGFFLEAHRKLRPVDFATDGMFLCGNAHSPLGIAETISQASGVAARAATILSQVRINIDPILAHVAEENCDGCAFCVAPCPSQVLSIVEYSENGKTRHRVQVNESLCKGCGVCMGTCPKHGIFVAHFRPEALSAQVEALLSEARAVKTDHGEFEPLILALCCYWCSYTGADLAGTSRIQYPPNVRIVRVQCTGMINLSLVVEALLGGADGVLVCGCHPGDCHYVSGNLRAESRAEAVRLMLDDFGLEQERFRLEWVSASEGGRFAQVVTEMVEQVKHVGPSPYHGAAAEGVGCQATAVSENHCNCTQP
jgi:heterodisulfide reductase subunit A-like polyferredoxin/coenzyme F420-reducing hydrogenase delta subunit